MSRLQRLMAGDPPRNGGGAGEGGGPDFSRRRFLVTGVAAGSLAFGFVRTASSAMDPATPTGEPAAATAPLWEPGLWYSIDREGMVTVNIIRAEMGQHIGTALARILADELEADWSKVRIIHVDSDPKWGLMVTGGSWSVWQTFPVFSRAGAAGRRALLELGAHLLGVPVERCTARAGQIGDGTHSISYGEIVAHAHKHPPSLRSFSPAELAALPLKAADQRRLIGRTVRALDINTKTNGQARYGIDARLPGMVYARPKLPPTRNGSKVVAVDESEARQVKGYLQHLVIDDPSDTVPGWVLVIAESYPAAIKATERLKVQWTPGPGARVSEQDIQKHARELIAKPDGGVLLDVGDADVEPTFQSAASRLELEYTTATVLHMQLEPVNALAVDQDGVMEIHTGNQWQSLILPTLAKALDRPAEQIILRSYMLGGGFGRRLNGDYTVPAALAAKALKRPVKLVLTREDDTHFDSVRSPSVQKIRMAFDAGGRPIAMDYHACAGWPTEVMAGALLSKGVNGSYDPFAIAGADHWYDLPRQRLRALSNDLANASFRPGWLRSVGPGWTTWALESFMDEAALHGKVDPVRLRLGLLTAAGRNAGTSPNSVGGAQRMAEVVRRAAARGGWSTTQPADTALGLATSFGQERDMPTWTACVARVKVDRASGRVAVLKLTVVIDAGTIVDPDGALAQVQGATLWGLSMALHEGTEFVNGQVRDLNLNTYQPLRIADVPELDISFVASTEVPVGLGEPAVTVVAPAIGNAIFRAVGARVRALPITAAAVKAALPA